MNSPRDFRYASYCFGAFFLFSIFIYAFNPAPKFTPSPFVMLGFYVACCGVAAILERLDRR